MTQNAWIDLKIATTESSLTKPRVNRTKNHIIVPVSGVVPEQTSQVQEAGEATAESSRSLSAANL